MKKILQIVNQMYPHIGGIEQVARDIEIALGERDDIEQKIICFNSDASDGEITCYKKETVRDSVDGIEVIRCGIIAKAASQSISLTFQAQLKKIMNEFSPDIVIFHYPNPFEAHYLLKYKKENFKLVVYWHLDITRQKILGKFFHGQNLRLLKRADKIIATSPNYIKSSKYLSNFTEKCIVIPSSVNPKKLEITEKSTEISRKIREKHGDKIICFGIGRHVPYKGYTYLIDAAKMLDNRFEVIIGGSGPLTAELKTQAKDCPNIEFPGRLDDEELVAYYLVCDIFCFPSITKNEAFGLALAEGMYFEKPAVTFTIPGSGVNYVSLDGITGIECPNCDSKSYAKALKRLAGSPELRTKYGKSAKQRVLDNFTFEKFKSNLFELIDNI